MPPPFAAGEDPAWSLCPSSPVLESVHPVLVPSIEPIWLSDARLDDDEELIDEPWAPGLRLRKERNPNPPSWSIESSDDIVDVTQTRVEVNGVDPDPWTSKLVLGHMVSSSGEVYFGRPASEPPIISAMPKRVRDRLIDSPRVRNRRVLPLVFDDEHGDDISISACPDSGSAANIISLDTVKRLGRDVMPCQGEPAEFSLANGKIVRAVGEMTASCLFGQGTPSPELSLTCVFNVFVSLAVPLIMGMPFLEATETYSMHRNRLVEEKSQSSVIQVNSVGWPKKMLLCALGAHVSPVIADTGADLNFVNAAFLKSRDFEVEKAAHEVMFADGTTAVTVGVVITSFAIAQKGRSFDEDRRLIDVSFYVLENLSSDIIIGQDAVEDLDVFNTYSEAFVSRSNVLEAGIIRYVGKFERTISEVWRWMGGKKRDDHIHHPHESEIRKQLDNHRRQMSERSEASYPSQTRSRSVGLPPLTASPGSTQMLPSIWSTQRDIDLSPVETGVKLEDSHGGYVRTAEGCNASSFKTQYLLESDRSTHFEACTYYCPVAGCPRSEVGKGFRRKHEMIRHGLVHESASDRSTHVEVCTYYCPVAGCSRSEVGKGFRRKNEMIRHGLIHESAGFVCPFCPGREHKYPRPDNLTRHIRAHHSDKDQGDPLLKAALSGVYGGPNRGRQ